MTALLPQNAKAIQQNTSTALIINTDFWTPDCQNIHVFKMLVSDHVISLSTELHGAQHLAKHLYATGLTVQGTDKGSDTAAEDNCWIHRGVS